MNPLWKSQVLAVLRLEIQKSFFSRRGLWIYLLALIPVLIFGGHSWDVQRTRERRARDLDRAPHVTTAKLRQVKEGMSREELVRLLGEADDRSTFRTRRGSFENMRYSSRDADIDVRLHEGEVERIRWRGSCDLAEDTVIFAGVFQLFFLRLAVFFGCVFVFLNLFRGEMLDRSLHYYWLAPVRREVVVAGKFLAGLAATVAIFTTSVVLQIAVMNTHFDAATLDQYMAGDGWRHALAYVGVTALACAGYGSVFLASGLLLRNPLIPAAVILGWESLNGILPAVLRQISVIYWLKSLCPVEIPISKGVPPPLALLALNVDPAHPAVAVTGLLAVSAGLLVLAAWKARRLEITYAAE